MRISYFNENFSKNQVNDMNALKNTIICLLLTTLLVSVLAFSVGAATQYILGDADRDGAVATTDATVIQRRLTGMTTPTFDEKAADVDGNGLDITDATFILRYATLFDVPYPIGQTVTVMPTAPRDEYELPIIPNK